MSNAPDRYEKFVVPEDIAKIDYEKDAKLPNAGTFIIQREDHTVGNLLRMQLHKDPTVTFAGYRIPHPLEYQMLIKVRTTGTKTPTASVQDSLAELKDIFADLRTQFREESRRVSG